MRKAAATGLDVLATPSTVNAMDDSSALSELEFPGTHSELITRVLGPSMTGNVFDGKLIVGECIGNDGDTSRRKTAMFGARFICNSVEK